VRAAALPMSPLSLSPRTRIQTMTVRHDGCSGEERDHYAIFCASINKIGFVACRIWEIASSLIL
jgi:hypothetical protein